MEINNINQKIAKYIEKSNQHPELSHIYALLSDNIIRKITKKTATITFTRHGNELIQDGKITQSKNRIGRNIITTPEDIFNQDPLASDYLNTKIKYTNSINATYANKFINNKIIWLEYFNKYLSKHNQNITLKNNSNRYLSIHPHLIQKSNPINSIKISIIMCSFNDQETIQGAAQSILNQTHRNLELIIINDLSTDNTGELANNIRQKDPRVKVIHNLKNLGAYISRNIALNSLTGDYFTCHDADDIALPTRLEKQLENILFEKSTSSICLMLRVSPDGEITRKSKPNTNSPDGYAKLCHISGMHNTKFFKKHLGYWDSVRVGGDTELLNRVKKIEQAKTSVLNSIEYLALDCETSTTRDSVIGLFTEKGKSVRDEYKKSWMQWHASSNETYLTFPQIERKFFAPIEILNKGQ